jgi:hypothetical protein
MPLNAADSELPCWDTSQVGEHAEQVSLSHKPEAVSRGEIERLQVWSIQVWAGHGDAEQ